MLEDGARDVEEEFIYNEYAIDDTLDPLNRLLNYHSSDFSLQRQFLLRELADTVRFAGFEQSANLIIPLLKGFTNDCEPLVRRMLVQQLSEVASYFVSEGGEAGYDHLLRKFIPIGFELVVDKNVEVGMAALLALKDLGGLVKPEHVHEHLLEVVIMLSRDERAGDYRVVAASLFNELAEIFGKDCCISRVLPEVELLANDSNFTVRKTVGENLGKICMVVQEATAESFVLPIYLSLCRDDIWGVRKACAENIEQVALGVSSEARSSRLVPAFCLLLEDSSRWVRNGAYEYLGKFLHTLRPTDLTPKLLKMYTDMAFQSENGDNDYSEPCAFSFPAVVSVVGRERWSEAEDAYATLLKDIKWKVRSSLAHSLHEFALILGREITESHLVTAFEVLLRDLDEVRIGVVQNVDVFLRVTSPETRERLVLLLCHVPLESENWRLRSAVARRIGHVGLLLDPSSSTALTSVIEMVKSLLDDSVMEVRRSTYHSAAILLKHLAEAGEENSRRSYVQTLVGIADHYSFRGRLMFPYIAEELAKLGDVALLEKYFLEGLLRLASDSVSNVRQAVLAAVTRTFSTHPSLSGNPKVQQIESIVKGPSFGE